MSYLAALVSPRFGAETSPAMALGKADVQVSSPGLDAATVPPAIFVLLSQGGFVIWSPDVARQLGLRGFSLLQHDLSADETSWMAAKSPSWAAQGKPETVWFAACPTGASLDARKQPVCGQSLPKGVVEVAAKNGDSCSVNGLPDAAEGEVSVVQLEAAKHIAPAGATVCFRYFGGNPVFSPEQRVERIQSARQVLATYDDLTRAVEQVESWRKIAGNPYTPAQATSVLNARAWLASTSQVVEKVRRTLPKDAAPAQAPGAEGGRGFQDSGSGNRPSRPPLLRRGEPLPVFRPPAPYARGAGQQGARGSRDALATVAPAPVATASAVVITIVALSPAVAAWACANPETGRVGLAARAGLDRAMQPVIGAAASTLADASSSPAQRQSARATLRNLSTLVGTKPRDPGDTAPIPWGTIAVVGSVGVGVLAGVAYLVSPVVQAKAQLAWDARNDLFNGWIQ